MPTDITLELLIKYLGEPDSRSGGYYKWQCPYCLDSHKDNLIYTANNGILWCFASDGEHSKKILSEICRAELKNNPQIISNVSVKKSEEVRLDKFAIVCNDEKQKQFVQYAASKMLDLMGNIEAQTYLLKMRGITKETAKRVILGYDSEKQRWVIPTIKYSTEYGTYLLGFEYRPLNFDKSGLSREKGTPTSLAQINSYNDQRNLVIVEGYFDGYALYQHLTEQNSINSFHIVTCCNGAGGLLKQLDIVDFTKYEKCYLLIDNDDVSKPIAQKICEKYPQIINLTPKLFKSCKCKDFNEHYLKCIYKKRILEQKNIDKIGNIDDLTNYIKDLESCSTSEKINKAYCIKKSQSKEEIIIECVKFFNHRFNKSYIAKILTGTPNFYNTLKDNPEVTNTPYYELFSKLEYSEIKEILNKLIKSGKLKTENSRTWGKLFVQD